MLFSFTVKFDSEIRVENYFFFYLEEKKNSEPTERSKQVENREVAWTDSKRSRGSSSVGQRGLEH